MLIVSNGAFKSGSTWLDRIVNQLVRSRPIPREFQNPRWVHQSVTPELFERFLDEVDVSAADYLSKNHIRDERLRAVLLAHEQVRVLNVTRDLRDVLVSAYFHDRREGRADGEIAEYWDGLGRRRIQQVITHHRLWNTGHAQVFVTSYEALQASFGAQVEALAAFLGVEGVNVDDVAAATDFERMRGPATGNGERFHRKGIVGDWQNHLSPRIVAELAELAAAPTDALVAPGLPSRGSGTAAAEEPDLGDEEDD
jgi:sulfotransferase family protein